MNKKICSSCKEFKHIELFSVCKRNRDRLLYSCKECVSKNRNRDTYLKYYKKNKKRIKAYYEANKEKIAKKVKARHKRNPERFQDVRLRSWYKISKLDYDKMSKQQKGLCKICKKKEKLVVDHNHKSDAVRGLLCSLCNQGLGLFKENKKSLKNAVIYLNGK